MRRRTTAAAIRLVVMKMRLQNWIAESPQYMAARGQFSLNLWTMASNFSEVGHMRVKNGISTKINTTPVTRQMILNIMTRLGIYMRKQKCTFFLSWIICNKKPTNQPNNQPTNQPPRIKIKILTLRGIYSQFLARCKEKSIKRQA